MKKFTFILIIGIFLLIISGCALKLFSNDSQNEMLCNEEGRKYQNYIAFLYPSTAKSDGTVYTLVDFSSVYNKKMSTCLFYYYLNGKEFKNWKAINDQEHRIITDLSTEETIYEYWAIQKSGSIKENFCQGEKCLKAEEFNKKYKELFGQKIDNPIQ